MRVKGLGRQFKVQGQGSKVSGPRLEFKIQGLGFKVEGPKVGPKIISKAHVPKLGPILESHPICFKLQVQGIGSQTQGPGYRVPTSGFKVQGTMSRV